MSHQFKDIVIAAALVSFTAVPSAFAAAKLSIVGAGNYGLSSIEYADAATDTSITRKGGIGFGGGALVEVGLGRLGVEVGALYMHRSTKTEIKLLGTALPTTEETHGALQIPLMFRFGRMISFGAGGFYELGLKADSANDYGLVAGPRLTLPVGVFFDGRFAYGLKSHTVGPKNFNSMEAQLLIGFSFGPRK